MSESESDALPLGDTPIFRTDDIIARFWGFVNRKMKNISENLFLVKCGGVFSFNLIGKLGFVGVLL